MDGTLKEVSKDLPPEAEDNFPLGYSQERFSFIETLWSIFILNLSNFGLKLKLHFRQGKTIEGAVLSCAIVLLD